MTYAPIAPPPGHVDGHPIEVRRPRFDWSATPVHWIPGDAQSAHIGNALHLLFPTGERFFIEAVRDATDLVSSEELRSAIKPFIGQEAVHAQAHDRVLDHLRDLGIDPAPYLHRLDRFFDVALRDKPNWPGWARRYLLHRRLAVTAAIEHFTAVLGHWALAESRWDEAGADPVMTDLLRWHAAEEVEHRALVYDVYQDVSGNYVLRCASMIGVTIGLLLAWYAGVRYFMRHDPNLFGKKARPRLGAYRRAVKRGKVPGIGMILASVPRYLRPSHHPCREQGMELALAYLQRSPGLRARASA